MNVKNSTRDTTLAENIIEPKSLTDQSLGLIKHKIPTAMLLKSRWGIHTLFMKYPIDVLILDQTNRVAALKENMLPNTIFVWHPKHNTIIELPPGTIKKTKTEIGNQIILDMV